jgi:SAM-dependent methyltransferase
MAGRREHARDWNELAQLDPLWAILSDPARRNDGWPRDEFFRSGEHEVDAILAIAAACGLACRDRSALDFGCGVGRMTRALSTRFTECVGVDVSERMVALAAEFNADRPNCRFVVNTAGTLEQFESGSFDFICSSFVLQHLPDREMALGFIAEWMRLLAPGGLLIFQLPYLIPARHRLQLRRRLYRALRWLGVEPELLYRKAGLTPMRMNAVPEKTVRDFVSRHGGEVASTEPADDPAGSQRSLYYYVRRRALR